MTFAKKITMLLVIVASFVVAGSAQEVSARFTLAHPTSLGATVLPPGSYQLKTIDQVTLVSLITPVDGGRGAHLVIPMSRDYTGCEKSNLRAKLENGQWKVSSVCIAESSLTLYFADQPAKPAVAAALTKVF
jgi:hypothetical protein